MSTLGNVNGKGSLPTVALRLGMYTIACERYLIHARSIHAAHTLSLLTYSVQLRTVSSVFINEIYTFSGANTSALCDN